MPTACRSSLTRPSGRLSCCNAHVARANPVWQQCAAGADVLVIFRGNEHYISPAGTPASMRPTGWCRPGTTRWCTPTAGERCRMTTGSHAAWWPPDPRTRLKKAKPWKMGDSAPGIHRRHDRKAIVGIQVSITRIEGKSKLSQNREPHRR